MARKHKIKHYTRTRSNTFRAKPHPITVALMVLGVIGLVFLGVSIYQPVYDFVMSTPKEPVKAPASSVAEPTTSSQSEQPQAVLPVVQKDEKVKAIYLPLATANNSQQLDSFLQNLKNMQITSVLVDIKDDQGNVLFASNNTNAIMWGAVSKTPLDLSLLVKKLEENGLSLVVKMSAFCDRLAAKSDAQNAILYQDSQWLWLDETKENGGKPWLNPYSSGAREYISALAAEAVEQGASMVVLENVCFPAASGTYATFGDDSATTTRLEILNQFITTLSDSLEQKGAKLAVYLPVTHLSTSLVNDTVYGANPAGLSAENIVLGLYPEQFGGGYSADGLAITAQALQSGAIIKTSLDYAKGKLPPQTAIIPMLSNANNPENIKEQTQYIVYNIT